MEHSSNLQSVITSQAFDAAIDKTGAATAKRELRILQVFSVLGMGGAETWLISLLKYFHKQNKDLPLKVKFDILLTGGEKALWDDEAAALGATLFYVPFTRKKLLRFTRQFRKILATGKYDAIHDHQDYIAGLHFFMGAGRLPPIRVAHVHSSLLHVSNYSTNPLRKLTSLVGRYLLRSSATDIMGTSLQVLREYGFNEQTYRAARLGVAHCGFEVSRFHGDSRAARTDICGELGFPMDSKLVLFVGRLGSDRDPQLNQKNPLFALEVARKCIARDASIQLLLAGAGEDARVQLEAKVRTWGLENNIHFLGVRSDIPRLMLGSDLLLFPSLSEGLGMVAVEAQAAGLRVLASDTTPRECVVTPSLVTFLSLSAGAEKWSDEILARINMGHPDSGDYNSIVRESPFSIDNSAARLLRIYTASR